MHDVKNKGWGFRWRCGNVGSCADRRVEGTNWAKTETEMETDENRETEKERTKESTPNADGGDG